MVQQDVTPDPAIIENTLVDHEAHVLASQPAPEIEITENIDQPPVELQAEFVAPQSVDIKPIVEAEVAVAEPEPAPQPDLYQSPELTEVVEPEPVLHVDPGYDPQTTPVGDPFDPRGDLLDAESDGLDDTAPEPVVTESANTELVPYAELSEENVSYIEQDEPEPAVTAELVPEMVQVRIQEFRDQAEPEALAELETLETSLDDFAEQIIELNQAETIDTEKLEAVEEQAAVIYDQILQTVGIEDEQQREELVKHFIDQLRQKSQLMAQEEAETEFIEDTAGTREHKRLINLSSIGADLSNFSHQLLGRLAISQA